MAYLEGAGGGISRSFRRAAARPSVPSLTQLQPDQGNFRLQFQLIGCFSKLESREGGVPE